MNYINSRIEKLQNLLFKNEIAAALVQKPRNLFYYAGTSQPSNLWIPAEGKPILFTRRAHELTEQVSTIPTIVKVSTFKEMKNYLMELDLFPSSTTYIGAELDFIPYNLINKLKKDIEHENITNITNLIMKQRVQKEESEISKIRESTMLWKQSHEAILQNGGVNKTENEIAAIFEHEARINGGDGIVWFHRWDAALPGGGIVASGENAWVISGHAMTVTGVGLSQALPWGASKKILKTGDLVVVDYGVCKEGYHGDMARTYSVGKPSYKQKDLWNKLLDVHFQVIDEIRPGVTGAHLYHKALEIVKKMNLEDYFMGIKENRGAYLGHSIGLEIDEFPVIGPRATDPLLENTVITIEPKFMVPGLGSVMVEDDILITQKGHEILGDVGHELFEI